MQRRRKLTQTQLNFFFDFNFAPKWTFSDVGNLTSNINTVHKRTDPSINVHHPINAVTWLPKLVDTNF